MQTVSVKNLKAAKRYSKALMEFASVSEISADEILDNLTFVLKTVQENGELLNFLENPVISKGKKIEALGEIFASLNISVLNFLNILIENNKFNILKDVILTFEEDINLSKNILKAEVSSAIELDEDLKNSIKEKLEEKIKKAILPEFIVDERILGGLKIKINDTILDLSLKTKIKNLKNLIER